MEARVTSATRSCSTSSTRRAPIRRDIREALRSCEPVRGRTVGRIRDEPGNGDVASKSQTLRPRSPGWRGKPGFGPIARGERLRRALAQRLLARRGAGLRDRDDVLLEDIHGPLRGLTTRRFSGGAQRRPRQPRVGRRRCMPALQIHVVPHDALTASTTRRSAPSQSRCGSRTTMHSTVGSNSSTIGSHAR